jgi:hypothetical protein
MRMVGIGDMTTIETGTIAFIVAGIADNGSLAEERSWQSMA